MKWFSGKMMNKLISHIDQTSLVVPIQSSAPVSKSSDQDSHPTFYSVTDRVTISREARRMSREYLQPVTDDAADALFSYEIQRPYAGPIQFSLRTIIPP